jgi:2-oxoglutarate dehydrogenase E2 component (dihydrolipoamide succinyltransferase)
VAVDEILIEVETDKVVLEVPAPSAGVLTEIVQAEGATVAAEQVIARIDTKRLPARRLPAAAPAPAAGRAGPPRLATAAAPATGGSKSDVAMPAAAKLLAENQLHHRAGRRHRPRRPRHQGRRAGRAGRRSEAGRRARRPPWPCLPPRRSRSRCRPSRHRSRRAWATVPSSACRCRACAPASPSACCKSQATNAILTTFNEVNMQPVMDLRKKYQDKFEKEHGVRLGFMSFFVKAAVAALKRYPVINASIDGNDIVYHGYFDIGIAVGSPRGLVVPILRNADQLTFAEIEKKIAEFGQKAKDGKLSLEELSGGTFSISNGGVFGSMLSTPIINPPQSAILGVHATKDRAVVENGQIVVRPMNYLAMSYDHRIIDGREAVLGLVAMKDALEDPRASCSTSEVAKT